MNQVHVVSGGLTMHSKAATDATFELTSESAFENSI